LERRHLSWQRGERAATNACRWRNLTEYMDLASPKKPQLKEVCYPISWLQLY